MCRATTARRGRTSTPSGVRPWSLISIIEASPHDAGTAYRRGDPLQARRFRAVPLQDERLRSHLEEDHERDRDGDFTAHPRGSREARAALRRQRDRRVRLVRRRRRWHRLGGNLPVVPIHDLVIKEGDLVLGTHGRSFWILDDLAPLRQYVTTLRKQEGASSSCRADGALPRGHGLPAAAEDRQELPA